ncbi:MAG TPA: ankyrin repeat domain-containing protein, partial [Acidobacteriaceae bacterium]|nr:ankyrin repeat domain-containing protein [Acidobacteriaceae bacterium]
LLDIAIEAGQRDVIKVLLDHHADINTSEVTTPDGKSIPIQGPLTVAAHNGEDDVVRLLLQEGADVNQLTGFPKNNETALAVAVWSENVSTVYLLLTHGADITSVLGPGGIVPAIVLPPPVLQPPPLPPRLVALRDLLIAYGAKMPSGSASR